MTGYVHNMIDKGQTFPQFAMECARAFGALILMRDDPMNTPIPEEMKPDEYYFRAIKEDQDRLERLSAMTAGELLAEGQKLRQQEIRRCQESLAKERDELLKISAMLERVNAWTPPTPDHQGLKSFMVQQLTESAKYHDSGGESLAKAEAKSARDYGRDALANARDNLEYATKRLADEQRRCAERTAWVKSLRNSLPAE